jgi:cell division inhibitor SulA/protein ImuA
LFYNPETGMEQAIVTEEAVLDRLQQQGRLWRGRGFSAEAGLLATGFEALDRLIGGWPQGALVELLSAHGEGLSLLVPLLVRLGRESRWLAWVDPPWQLHAPALAARGVAVERLLQVSSGGGEKLAWTVEQLLASGNCALVACWPGRLKSGPLRRLQLAAERGGCLGVLFRPLEAASAPSVAALRLRLESTEKGLAVQVLKRRGGWGGGRVEVACTG